MAGEIFRETVFLPSRGEEVLLQGKSITAWGGKPVRFIIDLVTTLDGKGLSDAEWDEAQAILNSKHGL